MEKQKLVFDIELSKKDISKGLKLPSFLSLDLAYLCGIFVGDGSIYNQKEKNQYTIKCVGNPKDEKLLYSQIINPCIKRVFGIQPEVKYRDSNTTFGFEITSKSLFRFFTEAIGLISGKKGQNLCIPNIIKRDKHLVVSFLCGLFDTDGCITFKKRYTQVPYYPVITLTSVSKRLIKDVSSFLKNEGFKPVEIYDYHVKDSRVKEGFTIINRIELNGKDNLKKWLDIIGFKSPKHLKKIKKYREE